MTEDDDKTLIECIDSFYHLTQHRFYGSQVVIKDLGDGHYEVVFRFEEVVQ